jgi:hypothetical protein
MPMNEIPEFNDFYVTKLAIISKLTLYDTYQIGLQEKSLTSYILIQCLFGSIDSS